MNFLHTYKWLCNKWHDPVWSKVIATGIVSLFATVGAYVFREPLSSLMLRCWDALIAGVVVSMWVVIFVSVYITITLYVFFKRFKMSTKHEPWRSVDKIILKMDNKNLLLRWANIGYECPGNIRLFCSDCDFEIEYNEDEWGPSTTLICSQCGFNMKIQVTKFSLCERLKKTIQQKHRELMDAGR